MRNGFTFQKEVRSYFVLLKLDQTLIPLCIVALSVKARTVTVKGKRGEITKSFRHMPVELQIKKQNTKNRKGKYLSVKMWFAGKKQACSVSTLKSLIRNMITGVTEVRRFVPLYMDCFFLLSFNIQF